MPTRLEKKPPQLRVVSAPAKPDLRLAVEPFYVIAKELPPLFKQHWREFGRDREDVLLDPDWDAYMADAIAGRLRVLTARDGDALVGYVFNIVGSHRHYRSTLHGMVDMYWLDRRYRGGWAWVKIFRRNDEEMKKAGVVRMNVAENLLARGVRGRLMRVIFKRLGYKAVDVTYRKMLQKDD